MKVWLENELCTGCGCCSKICPAVFGRDENNMAVVLQDDQPAAQSHPDEPAIARVPKEYRQDVIKAANECPGEIIFVEP